MAAASSDLVQSKTRTEESMTDDPHPRREGEQSYERPLAEYIVLGIIFLSYDSSLHPIRDQSSELLFSTALLNQPTYASNERFLLEALSSLILSGWIRALKGKLDLEGRSELLHVYLLPDDAARPSIDGRSKKHEKLLRSILPHIDVSRETWNQGQSLSKSRQSMFDVSTTAENSSLFYLFNTLPSPNPNPETIQNIHLRHSVEKLLEQASPPWGLQTALYSYQRRCAAMMIQKENAQGLQLDPCLERRQSPDGGSYYYEPRKCEFTKSARFYETCQGGILAETMGLGKTLICIAVILLTRGQYPAIPVQYDSVSAYPAVRPLSDMCATAISKTGLPWKTFLDDYEDSTDNYIGACKDIMEKQTPHYEIPPRIVRSMRKIDKLGPSERVQLCYGTIIVVPANLVHHWRSELTKHVKEGALKILILKDTKAMIPPAKELCQYDIVLFSRTRFEKENRTFVDVEYTSPLKELHWLRIIIDEGHGFSSSATNAAAVAEKLVKAERRWVVTGTPARDLLGVEVDIPAMTSCGTNQDIQQYKQLSLEHRGVFDEMQERTSGAVKSIGALASKYLKAKPWSLTGSEEGSANWDDYIYRHADFRSRTYTSFSRCLRTTLEDIMIKTRPEDVEEDVRLPPLRHEVVRLEPSPFDKMTANLFVLLYTTNAVTSERRDQDYLFHKSSRAHLQSLTANLRQSAFYWVGFSGKDVASSLNTARKYLSKHGTSCGQADRDLLTKIMAIVLQILQSPTWRALTQSTEMGMFVENWPAETDTAWAFDDCLNPPMIGLSQTIEAQRFVNHQLAGDNPLEDFVNVGHVAKARVLEARADGSPTKEAENEGLKTDKAGIPSSGYGVGSMGSKRVSVSGASRITPKKNKDCLSSGPSNTDGPVSPKSSCKKRKLSRDNTSVELDQAGSLGRTRVIGTVSSKFSYLLDRVSALHEEEKILIFYNANYVAFYISQALDLLHIKHLIYANTLNSEQRSKYSVLFESDPSHRVLIMDLKQAAHGLNFSSASRVFFVNPPWRPEVEAQAIKRAHRIGQNRPVHVETLVLKGTVEEAMYGPHTPPNLFPSLRAKHSI